MSNQSEEDAWRSIVENYGERPQLEPPTDGPEAPPSEPEPLTLRPLFDHEEPAELDERLEDDGFVPPPPPPLPHPPPLRLAAWVGLFGSPAVLLVALVTGIALPGWLAYLLIGGFLGGFGYLVLHMQRGPRDPGDDGARL